MKKNYLENVTTENINEKLNEFIKDFSSDVYNTKIKNTKNGIGKIVSIDEDLTAYEHTYWTTVKVVIDDVESDRKILKYEWVKDFTCTIEYDNPATNIIFNNKLRKYAFNLALNENIIEPLENKELIKEYLSVGDQLLKVLYEKEAIDKAAEEERKRIAEEEKQKKLREEKLAQKIEKKKRELINYTKNIDRNSYIRECDELYLSLGWLAKHTKKISAAMPDYLENWFVSVFGNDAERKSVDSTLRTSGGYQLQWSLALTLDVDNADDMPLFLTQYLSKSESKVGKKRLSNTEFIYRIAKDYGFKFGKVQDLDEIKKYIPDDKMYDFELGYNA